MVAMQDSDGKPITAEYAQQRMRWEPVVEITQIKGDSETHPSLSPTDEFADYGPTSTLSPSAIWSREFEADAGDYIRSGCVAVTNSRLRPGATPTSRF